MNPTPGNTEPLDNIIRTIFTSEGDAKVEEALKRIRDRQVKYYDDIEARAKALTFETDKISKAFDNLTRQNALEKVRKSFVEAARGGADMNQEMAKLAPTLELIGAKQAEINQLVLDGAKAVREAEAARAAALASPTANLGAVPGAFDAQTGRRGSNLISFGREARLAAPAIPIPGTGISSEAGFRVVEISGRISNAFEDMDAKGKRLTVGLGAVALGMAALATIAQSINEEFAKQTRAIIAGQQEFTKLRISGTKEEIRAAEEANRTQKELLQAQIDENKRLLGGVEQQAGGFGAALADVFNIAGVQELRKATQQLEQQYADASLQEGRLASLRNDTALATRLAADAEQEIRERVTALREKGATAEIETALFASRASVETFDRRRQDLAYEKQLLERERDILLSIGEAFPASLAQRWEDVTRQLFYLNDGLREQVVNNENLINSEAYIKQQRQDIIETTQKYNDDLAKLEDSTAQTRLDAQAKYNQKLEDLAVKAADAAEDAVRKIEQKRADLATGLGRDLTDAETKLQQDRLDIALDFARQDAKAARTHADKIKEINRQYRYDAKSAVQDRNAIALLAAEEEKTKAIQDEQDKAAADKRERDIQLRDRLRDEQTQFQRERQQRYLDYQRSLDDAQAQFDREAEQRTINDERALRDLSIQAQREETALRDKHSKQYTLIAGAYNAELQLIAKSESERAKIIAQAQANLLQQARIALIQASGGDVPTVAYTGSIARANGGLVNAFQKTLVNERRRESYTDQRGRTIMLPEGMGYFTPTSRGRVNANGGGGTINLNVSGATVETIQSESRAQARVEFEAVLDRLGVPA